MIKCASPGIVNTIAYTKKKIYMKYTDIKHDNWKALGWAFVLQLTTVMGENDDNDCDNDFL